jgi:hypothetical protein
MEDDKQSVTKSFAKEEENAKGEVDFKKVNKSNVEGPKLSQNAQKLKEMEDKMAVLEVKFILKFIL